MNGNLSGSVHWGDAAINRGSGAMPISAKFDGPGESDPKFGDTNSAPVGATGYHMAGVRADSPSGNE
jgi:hypothetical protein